MRFENIAILFFAVALWQADARDRRNVITVCDVIRNPNHYANRAVAVVGRYERSVSLVDHYEFLSQDGCEYPLVMGGRVWPNKIQLLVWEDGMPKPPRAKLKLNPAFLRAKLSIIRKTTILGFHKEPQFKMDGQTIRFGGRVDVPNRWAVAYGRILTVQLGNEDNGFIGAPMGMIVEPYNFYSVNDDGIPIPDLTQK